MPSSIQLALACLAVVLLTFAMGLRMLLLALWLGFVLTLMNRAA